MDRACRDAWNCGENTQRVSEENGRGSELLRIRMTAVWKETAVEEVNAVQSDTADQRGAYVMSFDKIL